MDKIYTEGFSQNAGFASFAAFCFPDKVTGVWGGSQEDRRICYNPDLPMVSCLAQYINDPYGGGSGKIKMYDLMMSEGHDPRLLLFAPSKERDESDTSIRGKHSLPRNDLYWRVGCLGLAPPCSEACQVAFKKCVNSKDVSTAAKRVQSFAQCIDEPYFSEKLEECSSDCAPTYNMLMESEEPIEKRFSAFGAETIDRGPRPDSSTCVMDIK